MLGAKLLLKSRLEPLLRVSEKSRVMDSLRSSQEKDQSCRQAGSRIDESHKQRERLTFSMLTLLVVTRHISIGSMNLELSNKRHPWLHLVHIENPTITIQKTFPTENNNGDNDRSDGHKHK